MCITCQKQEFSSITYVGITLFQSFSAVTEVSH